MAEAIKVGSTRARFRRALYDFSRKFLCSRFSRTDKSTPQNQSTDSRIPVAARMVGEWWADQLDPKYADKRVMFSEAVSMRVEQVLRGEVNWTSAGRVDGSFPFPRTVYTRCDYDPQDLLLEAVRETVEPMCARGLREPGGVLPGKHGLVLDTHAWVLKPKKGHLGWTEFIPVPAPKAG